MFWLWTNWLAKINGPKIRKYEKVLRKHWCTTVCVFLVIWKLCVNDLFIRFAYPMIGGIILVENFAFYLKITNKNGTFLRTVSIKAMIIQLVYIVYCCKIKNMDNIENLFLLYHHWYDCCCYCTYDNIKVIYGNSFFLLSSFHFIFRASICFPFRFTFFNAQFPLTNLIFRLKLDLKTKIKNTVYDHCIIFAEKNKNVTNTQEEWNRLQWIVKKSTHFFICHTHLWEYVRKAEKSHTQWHLLLIHLSFTQLSVRCVDGWLSYVFTPAYM